MPNKPRMRVVPVTRPQPLEGVALGQIPEVPPAFSDDLKGMLGVLKRRLWLFIAILVLSLIAGGAWLYYATPFYTATATLVLDPRKQVVTNSPEVLSDLSADSSVIDTQVLLIQSRAVLEKAVDILGLANEVSYLETAARAKANRPHPWNRGETVALAPIGRESVLNTLGANLDVNRAGLSSALHVSYADLDAMHAARVANAISAAYLGYQTDIKQAANRDANQWLKQRVVELQGQVQSAAAAVDAYRSRSGLLTARGITSTESQLTNLDLGLNDARQSLSSAQARLAGFESALMNSGAAEAAKVVASANMQQLRTQYTTLANQRAQLSPTLGQRHPQMVELNRQLDELQEQINAEARRTIDELRNDVAIAQNKVAGLQAIRDQSRTQLARDNASTVELAQLQAKAESVRQMYDGMLARLQQTTTQESLGQINATIVTPAVAPTDPTSPKAKVVIALAALVGCALGALALLLVHIFDGTEMRPGEYERRTGVAVLAAVPAIGRRDLRVGRTQVPITQMVLAKPLSLFAEAFRNLRVAALDAGKQEAIVVQVTSGTFAEGKTVCSIAFAQAAAMDGRRVLLIDADVRRRSLSEYLGLSVEFGLMELLSGKVKLSDVIVSSDVTGRPHVLPLSTAEPEPQDRFNSRRFNSLLEQVKKGFDLIVIDSAPVLAVAESLTLASRVDVVVVVARWARTPLAVTLRAMEEIRRVGGRVGGTILSHVDLKKMSKQAYGGKHYPAMMRYYQR